MTWIIRRDGYYTYLKSKDLTSCYSESQRDAIRFDKRWKAKRAAKNWEACWSSSWPVRVVKLVPRVDEWAATQRLIEEVGQRIVQIGSTLELLVRVVTEHKGDGRP